MYLSSIFCHKPTITNEQQLTVKRKFVAHKPVLKNETIQCLQVFLSAYLQVGLILIHPITFSQLKPMPKNYMGGLNPPNNKKQNNEKRTT